MRSKLFGPDKHYLRICYQATMSGLTVVTIVLVGPMNTSLDGDRKDTRNVVDLP